MHKKTDGPTFADPSMAAVSPYLKESMVLSQDIGWENVSEMTCFVFDGTENFDWIELDSVYTFVAF